MSAIENTHAHHQHYGHGKGHGEKDTMAVITTPTGFEGLRWLQEMKWKQKHDLT